MIKFARSLIFGLLIVGGGACSLPASAARAQVPATPSVLTTAPGAPLLEDYLALLPAQTDEINGFYEAYARVWLNQRARIADRRNALRAAQSATTFDAVRAARLSREIGQAEQTITEAFLKARGGALAALTPEQRARVAELTRPGNPARVGDDKLARLLLSVTEDLWQIPVDAEVATALFRQSVADVTAMVRPAGDPFRSSYYNPSALYGGRSHGYGGYYGYESVYAARFGYPPLPLIVLVNRYSFAPAPPPAPLPRPLFASHLEQRQYERPRLDPDGKPRYKDAPRAKYDHHNDTASGSASTPRDEPAAPSTPAPAYNPPPAPSAPEPAPPAPPPAPEPAPRDDPKREVPEHHK